MLSKIFQRFLHTTRASLCTNVSSLLATLRKKTGYNISNCKKALELNNNNLQKAEEWLYAQAKAEGWAKTNQSHDRASKEGLIGIMYNDHVATMVEVNCKTEDAVRSTHFQNMVSWVTISTFNYASDKAKIGHDFHKIVLSAADLSRLKTFQGELTLDEKLECYHELIGEVSTLRRAICWSVRNELRMSGYVHPPYKFESGVLLGKYGGLVCYKQVLDAPTTTKRGLKEAGYVLAKEIVGNNPKSVGDAEKDVPVASNSNNETKLVFHRSINDPSVTVGEYMYKQGIEIVDFIRYQCGEDV